MDRDEDALKTRHLPTLKRRQAGTNYAWRNAVRRTHRRRVAMGSNQPLFVLPLLFQQGQKSAPPQACLFLAENGRECSWR